MAKTQNLLQLQGVLRHYAWGEKQPGAFIPKWLGIAQEPGQAYAELWLGAHSLAPSTLWIEGQSVRLDDYLTEHPEVLRVGQKPSELGFIVKILSAAQPLSLQAHPNSKQAQLGFSLENSAGVPLTSAQRIYKDANAKSELLVALTPFFALYGFKSLREIESQLRRVPGLLSYLKGRGKLSIPKAYRAILEMKPSFAAHFADQFLQTISRQKNYGEKDPRYWALKVADIFPSGVSRDAGILAMQFLNLVTLKPGEGLYIPPGTLHCYLKGVGLEVMTHSDNTLRGGLTVKPVDVEGLLKILKVKKLGGKKEGKILPNAAGVYPTPGSGFCLQKLKLPQTLAAQKSAQMLVALSGLAKISDGKSSATLSAGSAWLIPAATAHLCLEALSPSPQIYLCRAN